MRSMMFIGLFVMAVRPSLEAQAPATGGALELRADDVELRPDGEGRGVVTIDAVADEAGDGKRIRLRVQQPEGAVVLVDPSDSAQATRRWLGVQVGDVPAALRVHLGLEPDLGVLVLNIIKDSPADRAGLKQYDVVTELNGEEVKDGSRRFARSISGLKEGAEVELRVIQEGRPQELKATLSAPPADRKQEFKFDPPDEFELDRFQIRGRVADHGPDGWKLNWANERELPFLARIPHVGRLFMKDGHGKATLALGDKTIEVLLDDEHGKQKVIVVQEGNGEPRRVTIYDDLNKLKESEPDAYDVVKKLKDGESSRAQIGDWIKRGSEGGVLSRWLWKEWKPDGEEVGVRSGSGDVDRQFKVEKDGRVVVVIRKGKSQVEISFENENEMREKEPKLHAHFKKLLSE